MAQSDEFKVTEYAKSLAAQLKSIGNIGMVTACFHAAVLKDENFPPGEPVDNSFSATGKGARISRKCEVVERKIGGLRAQVSVRYNR